jgi:peptide/nickel transport system ATP-binding protein
VEMLTLVGIPEPKRRVREYPHQLSGGMRQRVMIAIALACSPKLLIADEPTTALDVTIQAQILDLMRDLKTRVGAAIMLITHDLGVVAGLADRVAVMRDGSVVESGTVTEVFRRPRTAYTSDLLAAVPRLDAATGTRVAAPPVLTVRGLEKTFAQYRGRIFKRRAGSVYAVDGIDLDVARGETHALVGESGSGKSTTLLEILRLAPPQAGTIEVLGQPVDRVLGADFRRHVQLVFQDPMASLDPRLTVGDIIAEPLLGAPAHRVPDLLRRVGLRAADAQRFPHEFSGGQRQRIAIARALSVDPALVALDEPVSALDVTVQAGILDLLRSLKAELGVAYLFVTHDLAVVAEIADRVSVMYLGRIVETGDVAAVFGAPAHPYTEALLSAVPVPDPALERQRRRILLPGDPPSASQRHVGCRFRTRCPRFARLPAGQQVVCVEAEPALRGADDQLSACHYPSGDPRG